MLWETAFVRLGYKPPWNFQFRPLEGVSVCLCVIGLGGEHSGIQFPYTGGFLPPLTAHNYTLRLDFLDFLQAGGS